MLSSSEDIIVPGVKEHSARRLKNTRYTRFTCTQINMQENVQKKNASGEVKLACRKRGRNSSPGRAGTEGAMAAEHMTKQWEARPEVDSSVDGEKTGRELAPSTQEWTYCMDGVLSSGFASSPCGDLDTVIAVKSKHINITSDIILQNAIYI